MNLCWTLLSSDFFALLQVNFYAFAFVGKDDGRWKKRRERRRNRHAIGRIGEACGEMRRKEKNEKEKKEGSILLLPVRVHTCAQERRWSGRQGESMEEREKGGGIIQAHA